MFIIWGGGAFSIMRKGLFSFRTIYLHYIPALGWKFCNHISVCIQYLDDKWLTSPSWLRKKPASCPFHGLAMAGFSTWPRGLQVIHGGTRFGLRWRFFFREQVVPESPLEEVVRWDQLGYQGGNWYLRDHQQSAIHLPPRFICLLITQVSNRFGDLPMFVVFGNNGSDLPIADLL